MNILTLTNFEIWQNGACSGHQYITILLNWWVMSMGPTIDSRIKTPDVGILSLLDWMWKQSSCTQLINWVMLCTTHTKWDNQCTYNPQIGSNLTCHLLYVHNIFEEGSIVLTNFVLVFETLKSNSFKWKNMYMMIFIVAHWGTLDDSLVV